MRILLDTHALLWFIEGDNSLSSNARTHIENPDNDLYVSVVSFYEIAIKLKINKLSLSNFDRLILSTAFAENMLIITKDEKFELYRNFVRLIW